MDRVEAALLAMKNLKAKVYVTGHLGRAGTPQDVEDNLDLFYDIRKTMINIFSNANANYGLAVETVGKKYANNYWLVFDTFERIQVPVLSLWPVDVLGVTGQPAANFDLARLWRGRVECASSLWFVSCSRYP
jgi:hypothetical protein